MRKPNPSFVNGIGAQLSLDFLEKCLAKNGIVMKNGLVWLWLMMGALGALHGQHYPMYSQYMHNQAVLNPAYNGSRDVLSTSVIVRQQWLGMLGAPSTQAFYFHSPLKNPHNNLGFNLVLDRLGVTTRNAFNLSYAYRIDLGERKGRLAFGLQGGIATLQNRFRDVVTDQPDDNVFDANSAPIVIPAVGFGAYYDSRRFYIGISAPYLLEAHNDAFRLFIQKNNAVASSRPAMLTAGCLVRLNPDLLLRPSLLVKYVFGSNPQLDLNLQFVIKDALWVGASYRHQDAIVGMLGYQITPQFKLSYSYDATTSLLSRFGSGSHELMLRYEFGYRMKAMSPRYF